MTHSGLLAAGLGTLIGFLAAMLLFKMAPSRRANSGFWRSINSMVLPNFDRKWTWYVGGGVVVWVVLQAGFQLAMGR